VTKEAAMAYLGKAYLFQGKYNEAASILDKVISSNKYGLYQGEYGDLAHVKANNCRESILEAQMRNDPEQMWNQFTQLYCMLGWRSSMLNFDQSASAFSQGCYGFVTKAIFHGNTAL
jgi:starch-binding outer membrane protein, SusD/RagB family